MQLIEPQDWVAVTIAEMEERAPTRCLGDEAVVRATGLEECEVGQEILEVPDSDWLPQC